MNNEAAGHPALFLGIRHDFFLLNFALIAGRIKNAKYFLTVEMISGKQESLKRGRVVV